MASPPQQAGPPSLSYMPEPNERAYYTELFRIADTEGTGRIGGAQAVHFMARSKLPTESLKNVWTVADQPPENCLTALKFATAVRLIQLVQNGQKGQGPHLATPPGVVLRPAFFEGVPPPPAADPASPLSQGQPPPSRGGSSAPSSPRPPPMRVATPTPPTPPRPPAAMPPPSTALVTQDPYVLTPNEQARYEELFGQYKSPDGYIYGAAAVEFFSKSNLPQPQLAAIWNMVDSPVDNRLDKVEFALAMHLIVCVSRKNLPLPGGLPPSLQQVKAQQPPGAGPPSLPTTAQGPPPVMPQPRAPSPALSMQRAPSPAMPQPPLSMNQQPAPTQYPSPSMSQSMPPPAESQSLPGPPALDLGGGGAGLSISDAFEGLSGGETQSLHSAPPPTSSFGAMSLQQPETYAPPEPVSMIPEPETVPDVAPTMRAATPTPPVAAPSSSYQMGSQTEEAMKLKATLQKLQAENISLKAQLGSLSEEELQVQKEVNATVAEISQLSQTLTTLRAQVLGAKSRLLEATAELKANHEKKQVMTDLIAEATATKQAIDEATEGVETYMMDEAAKLPAPAPAPVPDLFSFGPPPGEGNLPAAEPRGLPEPQEASLPAPSDVYGAPVPEPEPAPYSFPEPVAMGIPAALAAPPSPSINYYQAPPAQQQPPSRPGHKRDESTASAFGDDKIMGGILPSLSGASMTFSAGGDEAQVMGATSFGSGYSMAEISELKMKAREAQDVARDAEASSRQAMAQVNELRRVADEAEAEARRMADDGSDKKKKKGWGRGGGNKKKDAKEAERVAAEATAKRDNLMQAQSQANDSQALAMDTKNEAERLHKEVEDAEIAAASAASMQDVPAPAPPSNGYNSAPPPQPYSNGPSPYYPQQPSGGPPQYGQPPTGGPPQYGQPPTGLPEYGQQPSGGPPQYGYNPSVMGGGGGLDIPTPTAGGPYDNPFG